MGASKAYWRSGTMLTGTIGAVFLSVWSAEAADLPSKAPAWAQPSYPGQAVDGVNSKLDAFGGSLTGRPIYGVGGSVSVPLARSYGLQLDGTVGKFDNRSFRAVGGHLFWRDPSQGLIGLYGSFTNWNSGFGQVHVSQVGAEGAWYWNRLSVEGVAGVEFGNEVSGQVGALINTINVDTRFFDKINVSYYFHDNFKAFVGHRYLGGKNAAALGAELALPIPRSTAMASLFVEGRAGEYTGVWGGLKVYFGKSDKTLIRRHREDDPIKWDPESNASFTNQIKQKPVPKAPPPPPPPDPDGGD